MVNKTPQKSLISLKKALIALSILIAGGCVFKTQATDIVKRENVRSLENACIFIKYTPENGWPVFPVIPVNDQPLEGDITTTLLSEPGEHRDILVHLIKQNTGVDVPEDWVNGYLIAECNG